MASKKDPIRVFESPVIEPLPTEASMRALGLLGRWALRRMEKREGAPSGAVSNDFPGSKTVKAQKK